MFNENQMSETKRRIAFKPLVIGCLCIGLVIMSRLINMYRYTGGTYSFERPAIHHVTTMIVIILIVLSFTGFALSFIALVKTFRKPELYTGKGIAFLALILNGIFSFISAAVVIEVLLPIMMKYFFPPEDPARLLLR